MKRLSVVIPVYNVASFLDECMESVCGQTYNNIEIICVDDRSTDDSLNILRKWEEKDSRIIVISLKENSGLSRARNVGIWNATGDYITFVDSDDSIDKEMYEHLMKIMIENCLDVLGCSYIPSMGSSNVKYSFKTNVVMTFEEAISSSDRIQTSNDLCFVWRYVIKKDFLDSTGLKMNESIRIGEDMIYMMHVISLAKRIYFTDYAPYHYCTSNTGSLMHLTSYKPYLETSYAVMYDEKKRVIRKYGWENYSNITFDLARYTVSVYLPYLIENRRLKNGKYNQKDIKAVLDMPMIRDAFRIIGFKNIFTNWKEYIYYLAEKFVIIPIVMRNYSEK